MRVARPESLTSLRWPLRCALVLAAGCAGSSRPGAAVPRAPAADAATPAAAIALPEGFQWLREGGWRLAIPTDWRPLSTRDGRRVGYGNGGGLSVNVLVEPLTGTVAAYLDAGRETLGRSAVTARDRRAAPGGEQWTLEDPGSETRVRSRAWLGVSFGAGLALVCAGPEASFADTESECEQSFQSFRWNPPEALLGVPGRALVQGEGWSLTVSASWPLRADSTPTARTYASPADQALTVTVQPAAGDPRVALASAVRGLTQLAGHTVLSRQGRVLGGVPGEQVELRRTVQRAAVTMLQRALSAGGRVLVATCGGPAAQLERFRNTCQTVLDSLGDGANP